MTVATDGSVRGKHAGFAWLSCTGHYRVGGYRSSLSTVARQPVLVAELLAIGHAVCELTRRRLSIVTNSQNAVAMVDRWKRRDTVMPVGYPADGPLHAARRQVHVDRDRIHVRWAPGHRGEPLNEGAEALARWRRGIGEVIRT